MLANAVIVLWGWRRVAVALVAGAISALAFAPFYAFPVLWLTMPVFVWLIDGAEAGEGASILRRIAPAALIGWAFGFGFFLAGLWWIGAAFLVDAKQFAWLMPVAVVVLPAGLALFWAAGAALARLLWMEGPARIVVFAVVMSAAEWLRGHLFTGFPWNAVGYALTPNPLMMQSASVVGLWGLTLAAFLIFAAPAVLSEPLKANRFAVAVLTVAGALLASHVIYGAIRLSGGPDPVVPDVRLRIVQPSIPQDERWQLDQADETMARYVELSQKQPDAAASGPITHLIWPESAFPFLLTKRPSALTAIADLLPPGETLITGAARAEESGTGDADNTAHVFNSVYVIDDAGEIRAAYDKVHLVPFGEYLPFRAVFEWLGVRQLIEVPGGFSPGSRLRTLDVEGAPRFGPLICYEIIFPGAVVAPGDRPGWLLNVTNDAWYGDTPGPRQHLLQARVRAVEEGLPLVRAANSGISAIVDPHGRVITSLDFGRIGVVDGALPRALTPTLYGRCGDLIFFGLLLISSAIAVLGKRRVSKI
jgi:apolipoprotein N-acyltransferase